MTAPIRVLVPRYRCPFCAHSRANRSASVAHIARCWHNPDVRACTTCGNYEPPGDGQPCFPGQPCNCNVHPEGCAAGVQLPAGKDFPMTACPSWTLRDGAA
jgi:hypothetical protein